MSAEWRALLIRYKERQSNKMVVRRVDLTVTHVSVATGRIQMHSVYMGHHL